MRSTLYLLARLLGDVNAIRRGPKAMGKRIIRKAVYRQTARLLRKVTL